MVEVFKTSVTDEQTAKMVIIHLQAIIPDFVINFDLEDCDNILRLSGNREVSKLVINHLQKNGVECIPLS